MTFAYQVEDGKVVAIYPKCDKHDFYYKGRPPLTTGCKDCWEVYFFSQFARTDKHKQGELLDLLESAIHHAAELVDKGKWDFVPNMHPDIEITDEDSVTAEDMELIEEFQKDSFTA